MKSKSKIIGENAKEQMRHLESQQESIRILVKPNFANFQIYLWKDLIGVLCNAIKCIDVRNLTKKASTVSFENIADIDLTI